MKTAPHHRLKNPVVRSFSYAFIAFCCISTGVFMFPNERAAEIAVHTVKEYRKEHGNGIEVIFNVWKDKDYEIYRELLG